MTDIRRRCWTSQIAALMIGCSLAPVAQACVQIDLISIKNDGVITDFETPEDDLSVWLGVGDDALYTWKGTMTPN